jgi:hypothetical protein
MVTFTNLSVFRLYLLDLDHDTLEAYEFEDNRPDQYFPIDRLTISSLFEKSSDKPPGYYKKMTLSELQVMSDEDWIEEHVLHRAVIDKLWKQNAELLKTVPHADAVPFAMLYGSVFDGKEGNDVNKRFARRLTEEGLTRTLAAFNTRKPSQMSIFEHKPARPPKKPQKSRNLVEWHMQRAPPVNIQQRKAKRRKLAEAPKGNALQ